MYGQQFVPNQVYSQPNVMTYAPSNMIPQQVAPSMPTGAVMTNFNPPYRGGVPSDPQQVGNPQQWQQPPPQGSQPGGPPQQQQGGSQQGAMPQAQQPTRQRQRNNEIGSTSCVVHMRNVTQEVTQLSIQMLAQHFGDVKHIVMLRQMNQALVEMETLKSAQQMVDFFRDPGYAEVDGRRVYIRYSNHQTLTATQHTSRTLLVSMFNTRYDVAAAAQITPEIVYHIFANYGTVQRIVVLPKNESSQWNHNRVQALVQFDTRETAEHVKNELQGQPVTLGETVTFTLDIQFSRMDEIKTTNPHCSLFVDEAGHVHRPQPTPTEVQQDAMPPMGNVYAAMPQQWR